MQAILRQLFDSVAVAGYADGKCIRERIASTGLQPDDCRLSITMAKLAEWGDRPIDVEALAA